MASSIEAGGSWNTLEDVLLCECWLKVGHCPITGNEMKSAHMWKKIHAEFCEKSGSSRTEMAMASRWKVLNKELGKWRDALTKARDNIRSGQNLADEMLQAQMWFGSTGQGKKSFTNHHCWEVVKDCPRFRIISTGPTVVLNETPLYDSPTTESPMDSPMDQDSPIERQPRPIGKKAAKAARVRKGSNSDSECAKYLEQIAKSAVLRHEREVRREEADKARHEAQAIQREKAEQKDEDEKEMKIMAMDTSHMSPETKSYWKLRRRDIMRRKLFHDDGPSNTDWLNDQNQ